MLIKKKVDHKSTFIMSQYNNKAIELFLKVNRDISIDLLLANFF